MPPAGKVPIGSSSRYKFAAYKEPEEEQGGPWLNLWLGNLSPETVDEDLMAIFAKYGAMDSVTSYIPRTYAFVYFRTIEDAKAAKQALQGIVIRGKPIRIEFARQAKPGKTLWVGGLSQSVTKEQLEDVFVKFGKIEEYKFLRHRGSAFICFHRIEDAIAAQKSMNWKHLGGSEIRVDFQRSPILRREQAWAAEHDYRGSNNLLLTDQISPDEMKYFHDSPHHGIKRHPPYGGKRDEQPSNVLWVGYPPELQIDEELLHNSMILFGEIERIQSFPSRHYCYVEFRSVDEARRAKEGLQGRLLGDSRIQILFSNSEPVPCRENPPLTGHEFFLNEPPMGHVELFGPGHSMASNPGHSMAPSHFPGRLVPNVMPWANMLIRPFTQGFDPHHGASDFHEFGGGIQSFPDAIINNPMTANWKRLSPSAPGIITSGPGIPPPFRPLQGSWDEFDIREPKRSRLDGLFPSTDSRFQGGIVDGDDMPDFPGLPHPDRILPSHSRQTPDIRGHDPSGASPGIDYCWRGIIAKGGTPVCHARCLPIGNGIEAPFPDIVNCSARTGLDMLTTHYSEAVGFDMVFFLPDSEEDFASYTEFLRYLGQRDRAGVAKFDDGTTMFLVPPSDFLTKILKFSGPERLYGVVLKLPQQTTAPGQQLQAILPPPDHINPQLGQASQRSYGFMAQNDNQSLKVDYGSSSHERSLPHAGSERPGLMHSEESHVIPSIAQDHSKSREAMSQAEVSLTPELIATIASLIPSNAHPSAAMTSQMPSSSAGMPTFSGSLVNDNSMLMQGWGQEARTTFSGTSVEQMYNPMQNLPPPGHQYTSQAQLVPQFQTYTNITNGLDNSFQPAMVGMPMQEASLHMQQFPGIMGPVGHTVSSQVGQFQVLQNSQPTDASIYNLPIHQQITPATPATAHSESVLQIPADTPVVSDRLNADLSSQVQTLQAVLSGSGQGTSEGDADKDQRYHSTLQFAASLLLQIQQKQQAKAQAALGSGSQQ